MLSERITLAYVGLNLHPFSFLWFLRTVTDTPTYPDMNTTYPHVALTLGLLLLPISLLASPPIDGTWQLEFEDDFDGATLDGTKWRMGTHSGGIVGTGANNPDNLSLSGGKLLITATDTAHSFSGTDYDYSTSEISTFFNFSQLYGYAETRIKYPAVAGLWPAFWMMPDRGTYGTEEYYRRSFLKFDLSGSGITTVSSVHLEMTVSSVVGDEISNLIAFEVGDDSWSESTLTWNNSPVWNPQWIEKKFDVSASSGDVISFDLTDFVTLEVVGDQVVSLALADTFMSDNYMVFHSSESSTVSYRPRLVVDGVTFYPTDDAYVQWGADADSNYGSGTKLIIKDSRGNTATTFNDGMEVDIMETLGFWGEEISHVLHWDGYGASHQSQAWSDISLSTTSDGYHTYGVYWAPGVFEFYVDGVQTGTWSDDRVMSVPAFFILSLQLGGWVTDNAVGPQVVGQVMEVDYMRVWSGEKTESHPITGTKQIINKYTGSAIQPLNGGSANYVGIVQYDPDQSSAIQEWEIVDVGGGYYSIENVSSGKALRPRGALVDNNVEISQYDYQGWSSQQWEFLDAGDGYYQIRNKYTDKVMRPLNAAFGDDVSIIQYTLGTTWNSQKWELVNLP